jgi:hypothetical protein
MTPDKLSQWVNKTVPGGRSLVILHEQGVGGGLVVASWTREDVDEHRERGTSIGADVMDSAQDHADSVGESCRFLIQWQNDLGKALRSIVHRAAPTDRPMNEHQANAEFVSPNAMIGQLLNHISQQQRVINGSIGAVLAAYERALGMQQKTIESQQSLLATMRDLDQDAPPSEVEAQLSALKIGALERIIEHGPELAKMISGAVQRGAQMMGVEHSNGIAKAAATVAADAAAAA